MQRYLPLAKVIRWAGGAVATAVLTTMVLALLPVAVATGAGVNYVALGDSYTAGALIPVQSTNPLGCFRSNHNYASVTAAALGLSLTDMSCSGATTADMNSAQSVTPGPANPPQLSAVSSSTQVVSLGIGGNDIGFESIVENCVALTPFGPTKVGLTCKGYYDPKGNDSLAAAINALAPKVAGILEQIHGAAPGAKVFVVGYPAILPPSGACWPSMPFESGDAQYLRSTEIELDTMLANVAGANGATYVDTFTPSVNHSACTPEGTRWVEPLVPGSLAAPFEPDATGEAGMATILESAMRSAGIS
jgi:hypothetical protein